MNTVKKLSKSRRQNISPQKYVDDMDTIKKLWKTRYHIYLSAQQDQHKAVQYIFERLLEQDDIYLGKEGWYQFGRGVLY